MPRNAAAAKDGLALVKRPGTANLYVRGTIKGQTIYESTGTPEPVRAEEYRRAVEERLWRQALGVAASRPEEAPAEPEPTFVDAVEAYEAKKKADPRPEDARNIAKLIVHFGDTPLSQINQVAVDKAYAAILSGRAGDSTRARSVLTPLKAILRAAAARGLCGMPVLEGFGRGEPRTEYLLPSQARALVEAAAPHLRPLLVFLLGVGCRVSEALELDWSEVDLEGGRAVLVVKGKRRPGDTEDRSRRRHRTVRMPPSAVAALAALPHRDGRVFRPSKGKRLETAYADTDRSGGGQFKRAWAGACLRAGLPGRWREWVPKGRTEKMRQFVPSLVPHSTRHTWATWQYATHHDILKLKTDGDWRTLTEVMTYTKHEMDAVHLPGVLAFWGISPAEPARARRRRISPTKSVQLKSTAA